MTCLFRATGLALLLALNFGACRSTAPLPHTAEVVYLGRPAAGTLTLQSIGYGGDVGEAVRRAEESAFEALLFRGIPGSTQTSAMVAGRTDPLPRHARYFEAFFEGGRYATFMTESFTEGEAERSGRTHRVVVTLTIHENALRRDLERHGIIRTFGL